MQATHIIVGSTTGTGYGGSVWSGLCNLVWCRLIFTVGVDLCIVWFLVCTEGFVHVQITCLNVQAKGGVEGGPTLIRKQNLIPSLEDLGWHVKDYGDMTFESVVHDDTGGGIKHPRTVGKAMRQVAVAYITGFRMSFAVYQGHDSYVDKFSNVGLKKVLYNSGLWVCLLLSNLPSYLCSLCFTASFQISATVKGIVEGDGLCVALGGDHSVAMGKCSLA